MLPDALTEIVRGVGAAAGDCLLLDARRGRALVSDPARVYELCLNLKRAGFTRMVDFTGTHESPKSEVASRSSAADAATDEFTLQLTLRHPEHGHAALILKWKWSQASESYNALHGAGQPGDELQAGSVFISEGRSEISDREVGGGSEMSPTADNSAIENRQSSIHPSLAAIWPAASIAEREIFEMLGIPFAGNDLDPLLLEAHFTGNPLRRDYAPPQQESYIKRVLRERHAEGLAEGLLRGTVGVAAEAVSVETGEERADARSAPTRPRETGDQI